MEGNIKNIIANIKQELVKLKDSEDETIKLFYNSVSKAVKSLSTPKEETEEPKVEKEEETTSEEEKEEKEEVVEEETEVKEEKEEEKETKEELPPKQEEVDKKEEKELSREVSIKLKEAALELSAKDEVISVKDTRIAELEAELKKYKDAEQIELNRKFDEKVNGLVELYASLNIKKDVIELKDNFNESQIDKLILDLSAMKPSNVVSKPIRQTQVSPGLELSNNKKAEMSEAERAKMLFSFE